MADSDKVVPGMYYMVVFLTCGRVTQFIRMNYGCKSE
jgi:hypothetical protein